MSILIAVVKLLAVITMCDAMTMKQLKATVKTMRKSCQPKNNVSDEKIDPINEGVFYEEKEVMCYMACIMKMANAIKNNKLSYDSAVKQVDLLLPEELKEPAKAALTACRKVGKLIIQLADLTNIVLPCTLRYGNMLQSLENLSTERGVIISAVVMITSLTEPPNFRQTSEGYKDICEAAFHTTKCIYNFNPDIFFFP